MRSTVEKRDRRGEVELRAAEEGGTGRPVATGYAAIFGRSSVNLAPPWADFTVHEVIDAHAFDRTIREADAFAYYNHDEMWTLGSVRSGTLRLNVDDRGLAYDVDLPDTTAGNDVHELLRAGIVRGSSFAFRTVRDTWLEDEDGNFLRTLLEVALIEVSPVTQPAYPDTEAKLRSLAAATGDAIDAVAVRSAIEKRSFRELLPLVPPPPSSEQSDETRSDDDDDAHAPPVIARPRLGWLYA